MSTSLYLVKGSDVLRDRELAKLLDELLGEEDRSFALEEFTVPGGSRSRRGGGDDDASGDDHDGGGSTTADEREAVVHAILGAASSPPFMTASRVLVVRDCNNLVKADIDAFARWLDDPLDTTVLVFVSGGAMAALEKVLKAADVTLRAPKHEATKDVLIDAAHDAGVLLTKDAATRIESHLAEDAGRAVALVDILANARDAGTRLDVDDVEPYLGAEGGVPMYTLTNAIEQGDSAHALEVLHRLLTVTTAQQPKPMHPLQLMGMVTNYYRRAMRVDDPRIRTNEEAAAAIGGRTSPGQAGHARKAARALGTDGIREAFDALARADLDLKGARGIPQDAVMEVLVVRLARLSERKGVGAGGSRGGGVRRRG
ncbi:MAG: DNA polymerase III subunit delta [Acidimicrobiia bacterium]